MTAASCGSAGGERRDDVIQRSATIAQPAPAFLTSLGRHENLEETLRAAFAAHQRAVCFGERGRRQNQFRLRVVAVVQVIEDHHVLRARRETRPRPARERGGRDRFRER